jgi:hypothetical protein
MVPELPTKTVCGKSGKLARPRDSAPTREANVKAKGTGMRTATTQHCPSRTSRIHCLCGSLLLLAALRIPCASAAPDEIQVYTDDIRAPGEFGVELHLNRAKGRSTADYPGEIPPNHVFRATPEISLGIASTPTPRGCG